MCPFGPRFLEVCMADPWPDFAAVSVLLGLPPVVEEEDDDV